MNTLKKIIAGAMCVASLAGNPAIAQEKPKTAYTLELGATDANSIRSRLWVNNLPIGNFNYEGFVEAEGDSDSLYGWHRLTIGNNEEIKGVIGFNTDRSGIFQTMIGIRDTSIVEKLKGYGFLDLLGDDDGLKMTVFYGRDINKNTAVELFHEIYKGFGGNPEHYTELQVNHKKLFYRNESADFNNINHILGYRLKF